MKTYFLLLLAACQGVVCLAQDKKPYMTKPLTSDAINAVFVNTSGGSITVSGAAGQPPRIEVYVTDNHGSVPSDDQIKSRLEKDYSLDVSVSDHAVHATAKRKHDSWSWNNSLSISFKVYVPQNVASNLSTSGGSIHLDNLKGEEKFETSGGSLSIDKLTGNIHGRTSGGSIQVSNSGNIIDLETSGGSIHADNCIGSIKLETSGGSLHLSNLNGKIDAGTSGGSIQGTTIAGDLHTGTSGGSVNLTDLSCSLDTYTSGGSINVQLKQLGKFVKIGANGGHVSLQIPSGQGADLNLSGNRVDANLGSNFNGSKDKDHINGKLNGGGIPINVSADSHINLTMN